MVLDSLRTAKRGNRELRGRSGLDCDVTPAAASQTDRIDGEALVRALLAYKRGEPRVCAIVSAPRHACAVTAST